MHTPSQSQDDPIWVYPHSNEALRDSIIKEFRLHPVIAQILVSRGFQSLEEIHDYLYATGERGKLLADYAFWQLLRAAKIHPVKDGIYTAAVVLFALPAYRAHRRGKTLASRFLKGLELVPLPINHP